MNTRLASFFIATVMTVPATGRHKKEVSPELKNNKVEVRVIFVKAEGAQTLTAAKVRNLLADGCYSVTALEEKADAVLNISSEKQGTSSVFTHIPFTGQKIYSSAMLFDRKTGEVLWQTDRSDKWFGSPAKAGDHIAQRLRLDRRCK